MLFKRDGALLLELDSRPLALRNERPGEPVHVHAEVVQPAEKHIRGHRSDLNGAQQCLAFCFDDDLRQQWSECLVLHDAQPAFPVGAMLRVRERLNSVLPGASVYAVVRASKVRFGDLEVERGLTEGLILCKNDLLGGVSILRREA